MQLARAGATTVLMGKSLKSLESLYDEMMAEQCPEPAIHPINLLKLMPEDAIEIRNHIERLLGRCDAIIHNAGITGPITPTVHLAPEKWQEVIQLNLNVPYLLTHAMLPILMKAEHASILFTTANESLYPKAYWSAYGASKAGILNFASSLHQEVEANTTLRVNAINPGVVRTGLRIRAYPGLDPTSFPHPETIAPYYLHALSDDTTHLRGKHMMITM
jgi:NAD(P)-dependent dehydrogenase (short-subunit alcohol dehydrogenase family)